MPHSKEPLIKFLDGIINYAVRILAILMTLVILWGVIDVGRILYKRLSAPPYFMLNISDILATFGAFLAVLIAIEIFINITIYLKEEIIHVKIVMATALMAIAGKAIVFDYKEITPMYIFATAAVIISLSIGYWLVTLRGSESEVLNIKQDKENI